MKQAIQLAVACVAVLAIGGMRQLEAGTIPFYVPGTEDGTFLMVSPESRQTLFQALNDVTLTELSAVLDPTGTQTLTWAIFNSDSSFNFGSSIFSTNVSYDDLGLTTYNTPVSVNLTGGNYYVLELINNSGASLLMQKFREIFQGLPFTTTDNNFTVIDGKANSSGNGILPAFSVSVLLPGDFDFDGDVDGDDFLLWQRGPGVGSLADWETNYGLVASLSASATVPEPTTLLLGAMASMGLMLRRRCLTR